MPSGEKERRVLIGVTGASGSVYAERLAAVLLERVERVYLLATTAGMTVARHELPPTRNDFSLLAALEGQVPEKFRERLRVCRIDDLFAPVASGSSVPTDMVVLPCSMGSLARIATGASTNLLERAADVVLKQRRNLIVCPRETPLSVIHLRHMLSLAELGVHIVPAMPAFYQKPQSIEDLVDFMVGRVLELMGFEHELYKSWNLRMR